MITLPSGRTIGNDQPTYIVAEVGSNWRTLDDCLNSIYLAKQCGADAVKFQLFSDASLFGVHRYAEMDDDKIRYYYGPVTNEVYWRTTEDGTQIPYNHKLPHEWLPKLKEKADACGIEFMCTAFSPHEYEFVNHYVDIHKVASAECTHYRILEKLRSFGKPVILSTGAHGIEDVRMATEALRPLKPILLYCVAAYPAPEVDLDQMQALKWVSPLVGYSDHTTDVLCIPRLAAKEGACVIEKHFTVIPETETPDRPHSLDPDQFKRMVESIRGTYSMPFGPRESERGMLLRHNRRLIAIRDVKEGDRLVEGENFGIYRSLIDDTHAWHPFMVERVNGKIAKRGINAGSGIGPGDI